MNFSFKWREDIDENSSMLDMILHMHTCIQLAIYMQRFKLINNFTNTENLCKNYGHQIISAAQTSTVKCVFVFISLSGSVADKGLPLLIRDR